MEERPVNEDMLLQLINDNTIAQDRVCEALDRVSDLLEKSADAQSGMVDGLCKVLDELENKKKDRFRLPTDIGSG